MNALFDADTTAILVLDLQEDALKGTGEGSRNILETSRRVIDAALAWFSVPARRANRMIVIEDCCGDPDIEMHNFLMRKLLPRHATVMEADDLIALLSS